MLDKVLAGADGAEPNKYLDAEDSCLEMAASLRREVIDVLNSCRRGLRVQLAHSQKERAGNQ